LIDDETGARVADWQGDPPPLPAASTDAYPTAPETGVPDSADTALRVIYSPTPPAADGRGRAVRTFGLVLLGIGLCLTAYYWLIFDATVPTFDGYVYNLGRMNQRTVGVEVGVGLSLVGTILIVFGRG
jgi:hypothetical protein